MREGRQCSGVFIFNVIFMYIFCCFVKYEPLYNWGVLRVNHVQLMYGHVGQFQAEQCAHIAE